MGDGMGSGLKEWIVDALGEYDAQYGPYADELADGVLDKLTSAGWFLVRTGEGVVDGERVELENVHRAPCSVSYCAGANGWGGPEYPTCDGCNADGTITTTITTPVEAAVYLASPAARPSGEPTPDEPAPPCGDCNGTGVVPVTGRGSDGFERCEGCDPAAFRKASRRPAGSGEQGTER